MPTLRTVYDYAIRPHDGVGPISFGMSRDDARAAMKPHTAVESREHRLSIDSFHGNGLKVVYWGPAKTVQAITINSGGDIWGRVVLRPRYLRSNGMNLFGHSPNRTLERIAQDVECDLFVSGHPGVYFVPEHGLVLHYCDFEDASFASLVLATEAYFERFPPPPLLRKN